MSTGPRGNVLVWFFLPLSFSLSVSMSPSNALHVQCIAKAASLFLSHR
jgi:hypothetical protein